MASRSPPARWWGAPTSFQYSIAPRSVVQRSQEVQIGFNTIAPQQFTSDNDIIAAANAGQITLTPTTEVYRCSVLGRKSSAAGVPKTIKRRVRHRDVPAVPRGGA